MHNNSFHFVQEGNDDLNNRWETYSTKIVSQLYTKLIHRWLRYGFSVQTWKFLCCLSHELRTSHCLE